MVALLGAFALSGCATPAIDTAESNSYVAASGSVSNTGLFVDCILDRLKPLESQWPSPRSVKQQVRSDRVIVDTSVGVGPVIHITRIEVANNGNAQIKILNERVTFLSSKDPEREAFESCVNQGL
jgi:hypothetical protein